MIATLPAPKAYFHVKQQHSNTIIQIVYGHIGRILLMFPINQNGITIIASIINASKSNLCLEMVIQVL